MNAEAIRTERLLICPLYHLIDSPCTELLVINDLATKVGICCFAIIRLLLYSAFTCRFTGAVQT
jgi:hypothetical protein